MPEYLTYASSGVDVEAGDKAVELLRASVQRTQVRETIGDLGGFAGMYDATALSRMSRPVLATSTDGIGTKVAIAQALGIHDTLGFDLVGMVVDDLVVCGARPMFMTDYIACGRVVPERIASIVEGVSSACVEAGVALLGGETAEHPQLLGPTEYDVAGAATGVVERHRILGPERAQAGDVVIGLRSDGLHSNGFALVQRVIERAGWALDRDVPEFGRTLGEELLHPTKVYSRALLELIDDPGCDVHALAHVTGGGLAANVARAMPSGMHARLDRSTWSPHPVFGTIAALGNVPTNDLERTFNMGVGFAVVLSADDADAAIRRLSASGVAAWVLGEVFALENAPVDADHEVIRGAKGWHGGSVQLVG